jgi:hypothetical protein
MTQIDIGDLLAIFSFYVICRKRNMGRIVVKALTTLKKYGYGLFALVLIVSFQNCNPGKFENMNMSSQLGSLSDKTSCSVNGVNFYSGDQLTGYPMSSALYPITCGGTVTRTCLPSGQFDGSVPLFKTCNQLCVHPDTKAPVDAGSTYYSYSKSAGTSQADCDAAKVTSVCQASTGEFYPAPPATHYASCMAPGQTCAYTNGTGIAVPTGNTVGSTVMGYVAQSATYPTLCGNQQTRTCQSNGTWTGSTPLYTSCVQKCLNPNTNMPETANTQFTYYTISSGTQAQCDAALKVSTCSASTGQYTPAIPTTRYASCTVVAPPPPLMGKQLYDNSCASCHGQFEVSTLKGRNITSAMITNAFTNISAMNFLKGTLTSAQVDSIPPLFNTVSSPTTSNFVCPSSDAEKQSSVNLVRLTGTELQNSFKAVLPASVWNALSSSYYLIPPDNLDGIITNFVGTFTPDTVDQISRFTDLVAQQLVASSSNITSFFGSCASSTSFTKSCFDTFLSSKGTLILRSALASDDNATIWSQVSQATAVPDRLKTLAEILFNDPRFLYHLELGEGSPDSNGLIALSSYEVANRIAYGMTAAPPDSSLWADAQANKLKMLSNVTAQVDRIAQTTAFKNRAIDFVKYYVGVATPGVPPDVSDFLNGISATNLDVAATNEFNDFVNYIVFTQKGTLMDLMTSKASFAKTSALASIMETGVSTGAPLTSPNHPGVLTKPYMNLVSNPNLKLVQRGKKIRINMLCFDVPQPSATDLAGRPTLSEDDLRTLTRRQYIDKATLAGDSCLACHSKMNQLGYATETYDSIGRYSTTERIYDENNIRVATQPAASSSTPNITPTDGRTFANVTELETALAQSDALQQCFARKSFQFFHSKSEDLTYDSCLLNKIDTLTKNNMPLLDFMVGNFKQQSILYKRSN